MTNKKDLELYDKIITHIDRYWEEREREIYLKKKKGEFYSGLLTGLVITQVVIWILLKTF